MRTCIRIGPLQAHSQVANREATRHSSAPVTGAASARFFSEHRKGQLRCRAPGREAHAICAAHPYPYFHSTSADTRRAEQQDEPNSARGARCTRRVEQQDEPSSTRGTSCPPCVTTAPRPASGRHGCIIAPRDENVAPFAWSPPEKHHKNMCFYV